MPGRRENTDELDAEVVAASDATGDRPADNLVPEETVADSGAAGPARHPGGHLHGHVSEDRWHWRRKIRSKPRQLRVYRGIVAFAGLLLIVLGLVTGPLPGPGGIPLILLGLATWASEFAWAHRLMLWFKAQLHRFRGWTRWQQVGFWVAFFALCGLCGYAFMVLTGVPGWVPSSADSLLQRLPGL
jgi:uncharacterized protein (TIGR02611 family)